MKATVSLKDVVDEMDVPSDEHSAFLNRHTGELVTLSSEELSAAEEDDEIDKYPTWQQEMIIKAKEVNSSDVDCTPPVRQLVLEWPDRVYGF
jgi:hypothetical protein